jgi:hypothetical protein
MRRAARKDNSQDAIIGWFQAHGATVEQIRRPVDLLVCYRGVWLPVEVKSSEYEARRPSPTRKGQLDFAARHSGYVATVWDEAGVGLVMAWMRAVRPD